MEEELTALLLADAGVGAICGDRINWSTRVEGEALPAVLLHLVHDGRDYTLAGPSGRRESLIQADCWAHDHGTAKALGRALEAALSGYAGGSIRGVFKTGGRDTFEPGEGAPGAGVPTGFHRTSHDFRVWHFDAS